ncbi:rubrerythrin family protein [Chitinispirillales bacterium ANBcel5]|uniref:rubrerythrin n=1 Tax=Cellulosispirillum alkaliphilum TaxID=3039283 RepID=UPI002A521A72|nr:rubrerythrin family protein [Chitinispirillales bacterium ANBcel5]
MTIKGSKTEKNLLASFAGESQARNRYLFAAKVAKKEGYELIASIFTETAENERQHAKRFFRLLEGGAVEITATYPAGVIGSTVENLKAAAAGENEEHTILYPEFARIAKEEGFPKIATQFSLISAVEKHHEERYLQLADLVEQGAFFNRQTSVKWKCRECGHIHEGLAAPTKCPCCEHPQAFFEITTQQY